MFHSTPGQRVAAAKKAAASRRASGKHGHHGNKMNHEQRIAAAKKAWLKRKGLA